MECRDCRDAISARLDGEDEPGEAGSVDDHLAGCPACAAYLDQAARITRLARTRVAGPAPDLVASVLGATPRARVRRLPAGAVRLGLGAVALGQFASGISAVLMVGPDHSGVEMAGATATHMSHESSAWNLALAIGFLWVAIGTTRPTGLIPMIGGFVGILTLLSAVDIVSGSVDPARLATHILVVIGLALLLVLRRITRHDGDTARRTRHPGTRELDGRLSVVRDDPPGDTIRPSARAS